MWHESLQTHALERSLLFFFHPRGFKRCKDPCGEKFYVNKSAAAAVFLSRQFHGNAAKRGDFLHLFASPMVQVKTLFQYRVYERETRGFMM